MHVSHTRIQHTLFWSSIGRMSFHPVFPAANVEKFTSPRLILRPFGALAQVEEEVEVEQRLTKAELRAAAAEHKRAKKLEEMSAFEKEKALHADNVGLMNQVRQQSVSASTVSVSQSVSFNSQQSASVSVAHRDQRRVVHSS